MKHFNILLTGILCITTLNDISAQNGLSGKNSSKNMFAKGAKTWAAYIEYYDSQDSDRDISIVQLNAETGFNLFRGFSINGNAYLMLTSGQRTLEDSIPVIKQKADVFGAGFLGFLRWDVLRIQSHSLFVDAGAGMVFTNNAFPPGGTVWNFTQRYSLGLAIGLNENAKVLLGWRHIHISNGKGFGHPKNPAYDGNGPYLGLRFRI